MRPFVLPTHSQRLERWLGPESAQDVSRNMVPWYGPPIAVANVPGAVFATKGGEFVGPVRGGGFASLADYAADQLLRKRATLRAKVDRYYRENRTERYSSGFGSLDALISAITVSGQYHQAAFQKVTATGVSGAAHSLFKYGNRPSAGAAAAAAPGGTAPTSATTGAIYRPNPSSGTAHITKIDMVSSIIGTFLLYDRIFAVAKTASSLTAQAVTGVPTRYQSTTAGAVNSIEGNFLFTEVGSTLGATAHNWTVCTYTDQAGAASTVPSFAGVSGCIAGRLDIPAGYWFAPLATDDTGIGALTQMQCSASVSGALDFVIGHPLALVPVAVANVGAILDGINSAMSLVRVFDNAAMAWLELSKVGTGATTMTGFVSTAWA